MTDTGRTTSRQQPSHIECSRFENGDTCYAPATVFEQPGRLLWVPRCDDHRKPGVPFFCITNAAYQPLPDPE